VIRILIADDQALVRAGLRMILEAQGDLEVVGEAEDGRAALDRCRELAPDIVLMDIRMPEIDGLEATRRLLSLADPVPRVVVLTTFDTDEYVSRALADGAAGFLLKDTRPPDIVEAVRRVADGEPILSPSVTAQLIRQVTDGHADRGRSGGARSRVDSLSDRERDVAVVIGRGKSNAEIAEQLYMSVATVKAHVSRVLEKLDAANRVQVAICVHDAGLL
jgi:DNA-binding NarL/FixJ family response regulator